MVRRCASHHRWSSRQRRSTGPRIVSLPSSPSGVKFFSPALTAIAQEASWHLPPPTVSLTEQMLRRRPILGAPVAHGASVELKRTIGVFQLTMFGVGATVGTGIFFVLSEAVPEAGPAVLLSFVLAGIAAGLAAICYAEMASTVPVSGSTYSYA